MHGTHSSNYGYGYQAPSAGRYSAAHTTSSAFSASANPNEDWTKISDLAERRRIQNRIAQRNYRKKLKRRLEDLERRAASSSASPEQSHEELDHSNSDASDSSRSTRTPSHSSGSSDSTRGVSPEILNVDAFPSSDDRGALFNQQCTRQLSTSPPPPTFSYVSWAYPEPHSYGSYPQHTAYNAIPVTYPEFAYSAQYLPPLTSTLPTMMASTPAVKKEHMFGEEDILSPFSMSYASMAGIDIPVSQSLSDSNANTPPLTHASSSFDQSRENSPFHSLPTLPAPAMPVSPLLI